MEPKTEAELLTEAEHQVAAELVQPAPLPQVAPPSSNLSEMTSLRDLMQVLAQRVDQVAKTSAEQFSRVEATLEQMNATMELARQLIVAQDQQYQAMTDLVQRQEIALAALVRVNSNLTEIVAALLAPPQKA